VEGCRAGHPACREIFFAATSGPSQNICDIAAYDFLATSHIGMNGSANE